MVLRVLLIVICRGGGRGEELLWGQNTEIGTKPYSVACSKTKSYTTYLLATHAALEFRLLVRVVFLADLT